MKTIKEIIEEANQDLLRGRYEGKVDYMYAEGVLKRHITKALTEIDAIIFNRFREEVIENLEKIKKTSTDCGCALPRNKGFVHNRDCFLYDREKGI